MEDVDYLSISKFGYVVLFGFIGVLLRYLINVLFIEILEFEGFWGTFLINMIGSICIGIVFVASIELSEDVYIGLTIGLLGGFTTFSGYCLDTFQQLEKERWIVATLYFTLTPSVGIGLLYATIYISRVLMI